MQLISRLLNLEFEQVWSYQKIRLAEKVIAWIVGVILVLTALTYTWYINQPVDITIRLNEVSEHNEMLPPLKDAEVTIMFDNKTEVDTICSLDDSVVFKEIAHKNLNKKVRVMVKFRNYMNLDTTLALSQTVVLNIKRNPAVFGNIHFRLWNPNKEQVVANTEMKIAGYKVLSDDEGNVELFIPLEYQNTFYRIEASIPLDNEKIYMPCGKDDVVLTK